LSPSGAVPTKGYGSAIPALKAAGITAKWDRANKNRQLVFNYFKIVVNKITSYLMSELNFSFPSVALI